MNDPTEYWETIEVIRVSFMPMPPGIHLAVQHKKALEAVVKVLESNRTYRVGSVHTIRTWKEDDQVLLMGGRATGGKLIAHWPNAVDKRGRLLPPRIYEVEKP